MEISKLKMLGYLQNIRPDGAIWPPSANQKSTQICMKYWDLIKKLKKSKNRGNTKDLEAVAGTGNIQRSF